MKEATLETRKIYSVSELTKEIRALLEGTFPTAWVEGEISNFKFHTSGHMYFTLKDDKAQIKCAMFRGANQYLKFELKDGLSILCFGKIGVYEAQGQYQLYIERIEPKGVGALQLAFEQLKEKLAKEGLFDPKHKRPIPEFPSRIGIVTSPTGAVIRDMINILTRRFPGVEIVLNPVMVQGAGAKEEIAEAISEFNEFAEVDGEHSRGVDVLIVGRGGGSMEDLWAFNEEIVARAIYNSKIPVISAVGHETDTTIADFVADLRAPTPSAAAELVVPKKDDLIDAVSDLRVRLKNSLLNKVELMKHKLQSLKESRLFTEPLTLLEQYAQKVDDLTKHLALHMEHWVEISGEKFKALVGKLEALSPLGILSRGYSVTLKLPNGDVLRDAAALKANDRVKTKLAKGEFISKVEG